MKKSIFLTTIFSIMLLGMVNANSPVPEGILGGTVIIIQGKTGNQVLLIDEKKGDLNSSTKQMNTLVQVINSKERIVFQAPLVHLVDNSIKGLLPGQYKLKLVSDNYITEQGFWVKNQ